MCKSDVRQLSFCCVCFTLCVNSWPMRQTIVSQQPLKNSSPSFMQNCNSGISMHSRDSLVHRCKQYLSNWVLVLCYCCFIPHPSMLTRDSSKMKGQFLAWAFFPSFIINLIKPLKIVSININGGTVWFVQCSLNKNKHSVVYDWTQMQNSYLSCQYVQCKPRPFQHSASHAAVTFSRLTLILNMFFQSCCSLDPRPSAIAQ